MAVVIGVGIMLAVVAGLAVVGEWQRRRRRRLLGKDAEPRFLRPGSGHQGRFWDGGGGSSAGDGAGN